jgi:ribosomal protein L3 glutamine methyltransferase
MNTYPELSTIADFIRFGASRFNKHGLYYGHGTDNAWDEATALVFHCLHLPHHLYTTVLNTHVVQEEHDVILNLIERRIKERIPLPYLTHEAWFMEKPFYVDERVLIPRSPIAELIESQFDPWVNVEHVENILDLCTGSGCIAIASALMFPEAAVDASDISSHALQVANINCLKHQVQDRVTLFEADLFKGLPEKKYDIIVSNPPYVDAEDMADLPAEYLHEPKLGLTAGDLGLDCVTRILKEAKRYLKPDGVLIVEVGNSETALSMQYPMLPFTWLAFERGGGGVFLLTAEQL